MSVAFYGDYDTTETVVIPFNSFDSNDPSESVTLTNLANTDVFIYKDGSLTQRTSFSGIAVDVDVDGIAGNHWVTIDLSDNTDAGFYVAGSRYQVRMEGVTIDAGTVNAWIGAFSIGVTLRPATAGRKATVSANGEVSADMTFIHGTALTETATQLAGAFVKFFDVASPTATALSLPDAVPDAAGGLPISDAGGLDLDTLLGTLTSLAAETRSANLLDQLKTIIAVIESQRGHHTHQPGTGNILFIDENNGGTTGGGATGGISDPIDDWQDAHDTYGTDGGHDLYIMVAGLGSSTTIHTEDILPTNRYSLTRGPGRDLIWRPTANNTVAITVTNTDGCMFSGFQLDVSAAGTGVQNGIEVSGSDFFHADGIWFNATRGSALQITNCDNYVITNNILQSSGAGGGGNTHGIVVLAGNGQTGSYGQICDNIISDVQGDGVQLDTTGGGAVESALICGNIIHGSNDDGIDIVDSGCVDTIIARNTIGNSSGSDIEDAGTTTILVNNEQWGKQSLLVYGHFAVHIDDVDGAAGSVEGTNGTQGNPVDNLADAVLLTAGLGIKDYELHGSTDIILTSAHANWHFTGHNGSSVDPDGQNINGAHFDCLTLTGDLGGDDISARFCKLQSLTNATGSYDFCQLIDNATLVAGDTHFFQCASGVAGTGTPYIDLDGDDANARNLHLRGYLGGVELRTHTSTDTTSFDCPAGQIIVAASSTGGTVAMRGNINITDNASGAVTFSQNAAVNISKINAEVDTALNTAIPGGPTADSINQRMAAVDDLTQASGAGDLAAILVDTGTTLPAEHAALPTAIENADALLIRDVSNVESGEEDTYKLYSIILAILNSNRASGVWTINQTTGSLHQLKDLTEDANANPVTGVSG